MPRERRKASTMIDALRSHAVDIDGVLWVPAQSALPDLCLRPTWHYELDRNFCERLMVPVEPSSACPRGCRLYYRLDDLEAYAKRVTSNRSNFRWREDDDALLYSLLGGFWAVSVTDMLQGALMAVVAVALPVTALIAAGGFGGIADALSATAPEGYLDITGGHAGFVLIGFVLGVICSGSVPFFYEEEPEVRVGPLFGPVHGGTIVAQGTPHDIETAPESLTGQYLSGKRCIEVPPYRIPVNPDKQLHLRGASGSRRR